jgi:hypothetical protein
MDLDLMPLSCLMYSRTKYSFMFPVRGDTKGAMEIARIKIILL